MEYKTNVGDMAPDFTVRSTSGKNVRLYDCKNKKTVLLFFFDHERARCLDIISKIGLDHDRFKNMDVAVFPITGTDVEKAKTLKEKLELPFNILCDEDHGVIKMYKTGQCSTTAAHVCFEVITNVTEPTIFIIDTSGVIRSKMRVTSSNIPDNETLLMRCKEAGE
ncbi:peroxiredoxin [Methanocella sp. CWC-04]|uniref:thioredoxin-dependent peroxiredoxin n=2 Tax=Methanooceanicella nereidis TaxID=2052831 RepID=A0AAP2RF77_9EURY|nr:peroxiredoxin [Methanocella sp. CWC-04]